MKACVPELLFQRDTLFTNGQIIRIRLDDFVEHPISNGIDTDLYGTWSPDGTRVALVRAGTTLWTVDPDGSNGHQVDSGGSSLLGPPAWSPDGTRLAYTVYPSSGSAEVYSALVTGSAGTILTPAQQAEGPLEYSPDGTKILFISNRTGDYDVFKMDPNGSNQVNLTNRAHDDGVDGAHWFGDGTKIVFTGFFHIWVMGADGSNPVNLTGTITDQGNPRWSSTNQIYYVNSPMAGAQLFVMNANGTNQHPVETDVHNDLEPIPSPDGTMVAWVSDRDSNKEIYVANADGTNPTRVTNSPGHANTAPRWRPCP
jgi:TolB protein